MEVIGVLDDTHVLRCVNSAVGTAIRRHRGYVEEDDLRQEAYLWLMENAELVAEHVDNKAWRYLTSDLYRSLYKVAMKARYLRDGTEPGDYYFYTLTVLDELLPEALLGPEAVIETQEDLNHQIRAGKPINERGDKAAMLADVQKAHSRLNEDDKYLIFLRYGHVGASDKTVAEDLGLPQTTVSYQLRRALRRMADHLGGEPVTGRQAKSNARAQYETRSQE